VHNYLWGFVCGIAFWFWLVWWAAFWLCWLSQAEQAGTVYLLIFQWIGFFLYVGVAASTAPQDGSSRRLIFVLGLFLFIS